MGGWGDGSGVGGVVLPIVVDVALEGGLADFVGDHLQRQGVAVVEGGDLAQGIQGGGVGVGEQPQLLEEGEGFVTRQALEGLAVPELGIAEGDGIQVGGNVLTGEQQLAGAVVRRQELIQEV